MTVDPSARSRQISERLRDTLKLLMREMRRDLEHQPSGPSMIQLVLLARVAGHPGIGVAELARSQQVRSPTMSAQVKALEDAGLLERDAPDPNDRRRSGLRLSQAGADWLQRHRSQHIDWLAARVARLTPTQMDALAAAIEPLALIARPPAP